MNDLRNLLYIYRPIIWLIYALFIRVIKSCEVRVNCL